VKIEIQTKIQQEITIFQFRTESSVCFVCVHLSESQYREAVDTLEYERVKWEKEMKQYAKVC